MALLARQGLSGQIRAHGIEGNAQCGDIMQQGRNSWSHKHKEAAQQEGAVERQRSHKVEMDAA